MEHLSVETDSQNVATKRSMPRRKTLSETQSGHLRVPFSQGSIVTEDFLQGSGPHPRITGAVKNPDLGRRRGDAAAKEL
jgi:hypothetical protein